MNTYPFAYNYKIRILIKRLNMSDLFRPLFGYQKYLIAHKILKIIGRPTIWHSEFRKKEEEKKEVFKVTFSRFSVTDIMTLLPKVSPFRIMAAITMLYSSGHIAIAADEDLNNYGVFCNKNGESALHEGYYIKKVYLFWTGLIGIPGGVIGIIALLRAL